MKATKIALGVALVVAALYGFGRFFVGELGGARQEETAGVRFAAPPGFAIDEGGELTRLAAAQRLARAAADRPAATRLGIHFTSQGFELFWLIDRSSAPERLVELSAGPTGTRIETTFADELAARLAWAARQGRFDAPGTSPPTSRNLYH